MEVVTRTNLTCPKCGFVETLDTPLDYCLFFHTCTRCETRLRPLPGDCCVFCSYGEHHCIPRQRELLEANRSPEMRELTVDEVIMAWRFSADRSQPANPEAAQQNYHVIDEALKLLAKGRPVSAAELANKVELPPEVVR